MQPRRPPASILAQVVLLGLLSAFVPARPATAQACTFHHQCPPGTLCAAGGCRPVEAAAAAPAGRVYWVDRHHPAADDRNTGTRERPWKTIGRAAGRGVLAPGDAVVVRAGVYRESVFPRVGGSGPDRRVTYTAYPGEAVIVTGADPFDAGWTRTGDAWRTAWTESLAAHGTEVFRRELFVVDGRVLRPVYRREDLVPGTFFVAGTDVAPVAVYARLPGDAAPAGRAVEAGRRQPLFWPLGTDAYAACGDATQPGWLRVVGFTFRHAVNRAQRGAVCPGSEGALFEENTVAWTNGLGFEASGRGHVFRANRALDNGQMGFGGKCDGCLFEDNTSARNNWKGHDPFWEAGGGKFVSTSGTTFRRHHAEDNAGPGLWLDIDNADNVIEQSVFARNEGAGIVLELETVRTTVRDNVVFGTRWVGWSGTGLLVQAASHNVIAGNTFVANEGTGLWLRRDPEGRAPEGFNVVYNNLFVRNVAAPRGDAREIQVEDAGAARTNRFDGNLYWPHPTTMETSTFYFAPDASSPANFRSDDLRRWQVLTGDDARARLVDPAAPLPADPSAPDGWTRVPGAKALGEEVSLPAGTGETR